MNKKRINVKRIVVLAVFSAIAFATMFVLRIKVSFLTFDAKDAVMAIGALIYGPIAGLTIPLVVATIEMFTVSDTGFYGWIMNFTASAIFCSLPSLIYCQRRTVKSAVFGLGIGAFCMTAVMILLNFLVVPLYTPGVNTEAVAAMVPTLLLPFNLTKSLLNAALVLILYKPISTALKKAHLLENVQGYGDTSSSRTIWPLFVGIILAIACVLVLIFVLGGNFSLVRT